MPLLAHFIMLRLCLCGCHQVVDKGLVSPGRALRGWDMGDGAACHSFAPLRVCGCTSHYTYFVTLTFLFCNVTVGSLAAICCHVVV